MEYNQLYQELKRCQEDISQLRDKVAELEERVQKLELDGTGVKEYITPQ